MWNFEPWEKLAIKSKCNNSSIRRTALGRPIRWHRFWPKFCSTFFAQNGGWKFFELAKPFLKWKNHFFTLFQKLQNRAIRIHQTRGSSQTLKVHQLELMANFYNQPKFVPLSCSHLPPRFFVKSLDIRTTTSIHNWSSDKDKLQMGDQKWEKNGKENCPFFLVIFWCPLFSPITYKIEPITDSRVFASVVM